MTSTTAQNQVMEFFQSTAIKDAAPNQGYGSGGWRPPAGESDNVLIGMRLEPCTFRYKVSGPSGQEIKKSDRGGGLTFMFQLMDDPDNPDEPRSWQGKQFQMPSEAVRTDSALPDGQRQRIRIQDERLNGFFLSILGHVPDSAASGITMLQDKLTEADSKNVALCARMQIRYSTIGKSTRESFDSEYCQELITS